MTRPQPIREIAPPAWPLPLDRQPAAWPAPGCLTPPGSSDNMIKATPAG